MDSNTPPTLRMEEGREAELLRAARDGDRDAFASLVRHYARPLYRLAFALTRSHDEATALAEESLRRARSELPRIPEGKPFAPWLLRLVRNLSVTRARRRAALPREEAPSGAALEPEQRILDALTELRPDEQMALALRVVERLPYVEIGSLLEISAGATLATIASARASLLARAVETPDSAP